MPFKKGHAKIGGRVKGQPSKIKREIGDVARGILESKEYLAMLRQRAITGTLPPGVETLLYHYAYGKPPERVDLHTTGGLQIILEQYRDPAAAL